MPRAVNQKDCDRGRQQKEQVLISCFTFLVLIIWHFSIFLILANQVDVVGEEKLPLHPLEVLCNY